MCHNNIVVGVKMQFSFPFFLSAMWNPTTAKKKGVEKRTCYQFIQHWRVKKETIFIGLSGSLAFSRGLRDTTSELESMKRAEKNDDCLQILLLLHLKCCNFIVK